MTQRALVLGASGLVGRHLVDAAHARGLAVTGTAHSQVDAELTTVDVRDVDALRALFASVQPTVVVHAAAMPNVDLCEVQPEQTRRVNVDSVGAVAGLAQEWNVRMVFISTDYVFDGRAGPYLETDAVAPVQEYGRQKVAAEAICRERLPAAHLVVRTTGVYGHEPAGKNFVARAVRTLRAGERLRVPVDQLGNPTYAGDLATAVWDLVELGATGTLHVAGAERMSRSAFAMAVAAGHGLPSTGIEAVETTRLGQAAPRPLGAGLISRRAEEMLGRRFMGVAEGLAAMGALA